MGNHGDYRKQVGINYHPMTQTLLRRRVVVVVFVDVVVVSGFQPEKAQLP